MSGILKKILLVFTFILVFTSSVFAVDLSINSMSFDNSAGILSINSFDNDSFIMAQKPKLVILEDDKKAYFEITPAILKNSMQDLYVTSSFIKQVKVFQVSNNPNTVRIEFSYNDGYNPKNIQLKKVGNTFIVKFHKFNIENYYFQHVYSDLISNVSKVHSLLGLQVALPSHNSGMFDIIDSSFNVQNSNTQDYILTNKNQILTSKFYIDNIVVKPEGVHLLGLGSFTYLEPFTLQNPSRIVFDIPNAIVNPTIRNKEIFIKDNESIKVGQFDSTTARVVITANNPEKYVSLLFGDNQRMLFADKSIHSSLKSFASTNVLRSAVVESNDSKLHSVKLVFNSPIIYSIDRSSPSLILNFYNVKSYQNIDFKSSWLFAKAKVITSNDGFVQLSVPLDNSDIVDVYTGVDAKTLRIKVKTENVPPQKYEKPQTKDPVVAIAKASGKGLVVIDAGHGGSDCGATRNNIYEKDITLDVSNKVQALLLKKGYSVVMTRTGDETVSLQDRVDISESVEPDVFVSIHVNSSNSETPNGLETHYYKDNSLQLAKTVHASLLNHINSNDRGLFKSKFYVINHTTAPAILVEIGFISNANERAQIVTESRKQATAKAIAEGIDAYFKQ